MKNASLSSPLALVAVGFFLGLIVMAFGLMVSPLGSLWRESIGVGAGIGALTSDGQGQELTIYESVESSMVALADGEVQSQLAGRRFRVHRVEPLRDVTLASADGSPTQLVLVELVEWQSQETKAVIVDLNHRSVISVASAMGSLGLGPLERVRAVELAVQDKRVVEAIQGREYLIGSVYDSSASKFDPYTNGRCAGVLIEVQGGESLESVLAIVNLETEEVVSVDVWS